MITGTDFLVMHTKDFDTAVEFYGTTLGLPVSRRATGRCRASSSRPATSRSR